MEIKVEYVPLKVSRYELTIPNRQQEAAIFVNGVEYTPKHGAPRHPLYVPNDAPLIPF